MPSHPPKSHILTWVALLIGLAALAQLLPLEDWLTEGARRCREAGALGVLGFALLYLVSALLLWPATILTVAAGWIWGGVWGVLILHPVSVVADTIPFLIARRLGSERLGDRFGDLVRRIDAEMAVSGFRAVCLLRWCPLLPYNVMNYALGVTRVSTRDYVCATSLATIPNSIVFVLAGALLAGRASFEMPTFGLELTLAAIALSALSLIALYQYGCHALEQNA